MTHGTFVYNNEKNALNDNESPSLSSSIIEGKTQKKKNQEMTMSLLAHYCLLQPKKNQHKTMTSLLAHHYFLQPKKKN
jgi:hypothetical protein